MYPLDVLSGFSEQPWNIYSICVAKFEEYKWITKTNAHTGSNVPCIGFWAYKSNCNKNNDFVKLVDKLNLSNWNCTLEKSFSDSIDISKSPFTLNSTTSDSCSSSFSFVLLVSQFIIFQIVLILLEDYFIICFICIDFAALHVLLNIL